MSDGYTPSPVIRDQRQLREQFGRQSKDMRQIQEGDVVVEDPRGLYLRSPGGLYFQVTVSDSGALTATRKDPNL